MAKTVPQGVLDILLVPNLSVYHEMYERAINR